MNNNEIIDSTLVSDGKFIFQGEHPFSCHAAIRINDYESSYLILENGTIKVKINRNSSIISGTRNNCTFNLCLHKLDSLNKTITNDLKLISKDTKQGKINRAKLHAEFVLKRDSLIKATTYQNLDNIISAFFIQVFRERFSELEVEDIIAHSSNLLKENVLMNKIIKSSVNSPITDITIQDINDNKIRLSTLIGENRHTLINIWASWCAPCIAKFPSIEIINEKYAEKIRIINISIDYDKEDWLRAIKQHNISDTNLLADKISLMNTYCINTIPSLFIINSKGIIVERSTSIEKIEQYLEKYFGCNK